MLKKAHHQRLWKQTVTWQDFHLDKQRCKTVLCPTHLVRIVDITCCLPHIFTLIREKMSIATQYWRQWHVFLLGRLHTKCSPTCLASSREHNSVFTDCPLYTSHSTLFKIALFSVVWWTAYPIFVLAIFSVPAHITLLLGLVDNLHLEQIYLELWARAFMMTNDCGITIKIEVL